MLDRGADDLVAQIRRVVPPGPFPERRLGRALTFQALYEMDLAHHTPARIIERLVEDAAAPEPEPLYPPELLGPARAYARDLAEGVLAHRREIDGVIQARAPLWPLPQMSAVDRNVLRIGLYESLYGNATVPLRAAINEAVELAKLFGSETSAKFVNGVLGRAVESSGDAPQPEGPPRPTDAGRPARARRLPPDAERGFEDGHEL